MLVKTEGMAAQCYVDQIVKPHCMLFFTRHISHVFKQDNVPSNTARVTIDLLLQHNIRTIPWPALGPVLSSTGHLWYEIQRWQNQVVPRPTTRVEVEAAFVRA